ncbi:hypothetical protein Tco_1135016 [Tanacetum coccineum]
MPFTTPLLTTNVRKEYFDINLPIAEQVVDFLMKNVDVADLPRYLEFENSSSLDLPELTPVIDESTLLVTLPLQCTDVLGDVIVDIDLLLGEYLDTLSTGAMEINFNPSNSDLMSRSFETSDLFEELIAEIGLDDSIPIGIDDRYYDSEDDILFFEQLLNKDTSFDVSIALLPTESSSLDLLPPASNQFILREVKRFDPFFSLT